MKILYWMVYILGAAFSTAAQSQLNLQQQWTFDSYGDNLGKGGMVVKDIDNNGLPDIITTGTSPYGYDDVGFFSIIEYNSVITRYETKFVSRLYFADITALQIFDIDADGQHEIVLGFDNGEIRVLNSITKKEITSFFTHKSPSGSFDVSAVQSISFGDIDNNGSNNLVATNGDTTYVYDVSLNLIRRLNTMNGARGTITLANVDNDPAIESIYSGGAIVEFTGAVSKHEFRFYPNPYASNFSSPGTVRIADMTGDGFNDVLYASSDSVHIVNLLSKRRVRSIAKKEGWGAVTDIQLYDYTQDGTPDLFLGNDQHDVLFVYNGLSGVLEFQLHDPKRAGLEALAIADLDGQPGPELVWTSGADCSCSDHFFVYDMNTKGQKWMSKFRFGGFPAFDLGNIDTDPEDELLVASYGEFTSYTDHGFLSTIDVATKEFENESSNEAGYYGPPTAVKIGDVDGDGKNEILLGVETSYAFTRINVLDENYTFIRAFEANGMSFVHDIEIADIDNDGKKEVITTLGTHVAGSTHPDEWQNYIHIFNGETGKLKWKSQQISGMLSRAGNIVVGNVDSDPAKEVVLLRYRQDWWRPQTAKLYVIDGWNYSVKEDESLDYSAFYLNDFDEDGIDDIIAGTESGRIVVVDGESFETKKEITTAKGKITSLDGIDINGDNVDEYIFSNTYRLHVYDPMRSSVIAQTDTLSNDVGAYGSMRLHHSTARIEIFLNTTHTLYAFELAVMPNEKPEDFKLLTPINHAKLPFPEWIEFSWEAAADENLVTYNFHLKGPGLDTVVTDIPQTHFVMHSSLFQLSEDYTWFVTATDRFEKTQSLSFTFQLQDDIVLGIANSNENYYHVYPNPFSNSLTVENSSPYPIDQIKIIQGNGLEVISRPVNVETNGLLHLTDVETLPPGIYLCSLISKGSNIHTVKLIKP